VDLKGAFNADDHRIMFEHMHQLGMPSTFVHTCEQLYGVSTTDLNTPYTPPSLPLMTSTQAPYRVTRFPHFSSL
jgi:hypothetical protein